MMNENPNLQSTEDDFLLGAGNPLNGRHLIMNESILASWTRHDQYRGYYSAQSGNVIFPPVGAEGTLTGFAPTVTITVHDSANVVADDGNKPVVTEAKFQAATSPRSNDADAGQTDDWLSNFEWFIPKAIREPFLGCLREDRGRMAKRGFSRVQIEKATATQILLATCHSLRGRLVDLILRFIGF
jgi:hypothetical protein